MSSTQTLIALAVVVFWCALAYLVARVIGTNRSTSSRRERELDDAEQIEAVSKPAALEQRPRLRAGERQ